MKCTETRILLSSYLDGAVTGKQMRTISEHLSGCQSCNSDYQSLRGTQRLIAGLGRKQVPADLALKLRLAISREAASVRRPALEGFRTRLGNTVHAFMVPATAGALSAIIIFGLLIGFFAIPAQLQASDNDVPTMLYTPPELTFSPFEVGIGSITADSVVVEAYVNASGQVQDYRIISAPGDSESPASLMPQVGNILIFTKFRPATSFGRPVADRVLLSFSNVNVKG